MTVRSLSARLRQVHGMTLIELLITVTLVAILAAVVVPSYQQTIAASRRSDATSALLALAQLMERTYSEQGTYANARVGTNGLYPSQSPQGYYTISIVNQSADAFSIKATPTGVQASDRCGSYTYDQSGTKGVSPAGVTVAQCW